MKKDPKNGERKDNHSVLTCNSDIRKMLFVSLLVVLVQLAAAYTSRESVISTAMQSSLNNLFLNAYHRGVALIDYSGTVTNTPLTNNYLHNSVNVTGDTQEAIYGTVKSIPNSRSAYVCYPNSAFMIYNIMSQYGYQQDKVANCSVSMNTGFVKAPCRLNYHYGSSGKVKQTGAVVKAQSYDCTQRVWYTNAVAQKKMCWSQVFTFASSSPSSSSVTGVTLAAPFYYPSSTTVKGVIAVDLDYSYFTPILQKYAKDDVIVYLAETSTLNLVATSTGEVPVGSDGNVYKITAAKDPLVSGSATYITGYNFGNTWAPDGEYYTLLSDVGYVVNIKSYTDPQTATLVWKVITVGKESSLPTSNYVTPQSDALGYTYASISNNLATVQTASQLMTFFAGALNDAPNTKNIIETNGNPTKTGSTQQALWLTFQIFRAMTPAQIWSVAVGYESTGAYVGYSVKSSTDGTTYYDYRAPSPNSGCAATSTLSAVGTACLQVFPANTDGTPMTDPIQQLSYTPSSQSWYTTAKSTGSVAWSPLYTSPLSNTPTNLLSFVSSIYNQTTKAFVGEVVTAYFASNDMTNVLNTFNTGYTAYVYDTRKGYLIANNVGAPVNSGSSFISVTASSNPVIKASASYILANALSDDFTAFVSYDANTNMNIMAKYFTDSSQTLTTYVVNVQLVPIAAPTMAPTMATMTMSMDDDANTIAKNASIAAAVLAGFLIILVVVLLVLFLGNKNAQPAPARTREMEMNPMNSKA